jgi:hypothetical protein
MRRDTKPRGTSWLDLTRALPGQSAACLVLALLSLAGTGIAKDHAEDISKLTVRVEAPPADVLEAVKEVTQDQIIHGTYSYEKERILYGAHSAQEAHVFGVWKQQGAAFYKVADKVLSPRYFKDSEDIGTITVRYVVQDAGPTSAIVQIDAVFVDARNVHHSSLGNVESSEYAAIQERIRNIQAKRVEAEQGFQKASASPGQPVPKSSSQLQKQAAATSAPPESMSVPQLQKQIEDLRHQVELRVKDQGAQLKASPFHSAATLESVPAQSEVLIQILSPYWYGVETEDGHHGWIHHSQLEPLP